MPRNTRFRVAVYSSQRALAQYIVRRVTISMAEQMVESGQAVVIGEQPLTLQIADQDEERSRENRQKKLQDENKAQTITKPEVETNAYANAGFRDCRSRTMHMSEERRLKRKRPEDFVELTLVKIAEYPLTGDTKAIRVPGCSSEQFERLKKELGV